MTGPDLASQSATGESGEVRHRNAFPPAPPCISRGPNLSTHPEPAGDRHDPTLPRSLATLPDESLLGFQLLLAHRLDTSPLCLAQATGLYTNQAATGSRRGCCWR
jgi:hypothetical protein